MIITPAAAPRCLTAKAVSGRRQGTGEGPGPVLPRGVANRGDVAGELRRPVAGVAPDDDPALRGLGALVEHPARDAGRRPSHHEPVHPRGAGAERSPQPCGPKAERALEPGPQPRRRRRPR